MLLVGSAAMLGREILQIGEGRRAGQNEVTLYRRFRRRAKGLFLLIVLYILAAYYDEIAAWGHFGWRDMILFTGGIFIILIWALILAGRDLKETALEVTAERQRLTMEAFLDITEEIERRKAQDQDSPPEE